MESRSKTTLKFIGLAILTPVLVGVVFTAIITVRTMNPLTAARGSLNQLEENLGEAAQYVPAVDGAIPAERMEAFLAIRELLVQTCDEYGPVQRAFDTIDTLASDPEGDRGQTGNMVKLLARATFEITPFLARYFERRNDALLAAQMSLEEYVYIYAMAYHDELLAKSTREEIFSGGDAVSAEAASMLVAILRRQLAALDPSDPDRAALRQEIERMSASPSRLAWQDGLPTSVQQSVNPYRDRLGQVFCRATAGLEMERGAKRAIWLALE